MDQLPKDQGNELYKVICVQDQELLEKEEFNDVNKFYMYQMKTLNDFCNSKLLIWKKRPETSLRRSYSSRSFCTTQWTTRCQSNLTLHISNCRRISSTSTIRTFWCRREPWESISTTVSTDRRLTSWTTLCSCTTPCSTTSIYLRICWSTSGSVDWRRFWVRSQRLQVAIHRGQRLHQPDSLGGGGRIKDSQLD